MYKKGHIHFVGIGGIGMSGIAKILKYQGYTISGCDLDLQQKNVEELLSIGCIVHKGNNIEACHDNNIDVLVYSSAIKNNDPEITAAQERGIPTIPRALMLAELMRTKFSIAITGSHGKTTTTSLISHILIEAKKDPTVIIGGHLKNISTNALWGAGDFLVAEADESDRSLIRLNPTLAVVTNIDLEHLDTYKDLEDIKATFIQFLNNIPFYGKAVICVDDPHIRSILPLNHIKMVKYGLSEDADIYASDIQLLKDQSIFKVFSKGNTDPLGTITMHMPGRHNILNALAAISVARDVGISFEDIAQALNNFKGIERRFSFKGLYKGAELFDDYGHHPTEIFNTLLVARKRAQKKLTVVFQPHKYSRTQSLWQEFIDLFAYSAIDQLYITDIYGASEKPIENITSEIFVKSLKLKQPACNVTYLPYEDSFASLKENIDKNIEEGDLILLLGAGKVNKFADTVK